MARGEGKLTARTVAALTAPGLYGDGGGLYLQVSNSGTKSWILRYQLDGRRRDLGLGALATVSLADARTAAREARAKAKTGTDPIEVKRTERQAKALEAAKALTFRAAGEAYIASHSPSWRNAKHRAQWSSTLATYAFPVFGNLDVADIDQGLVLRVLEPIWTAKPETASRVRGRIENILDWAKVRGLRDGENPARWQGGLQMALPEPGKVRKEQHFPALPYANMATFWQALATKEGMAAIALRFTILTAARSGEVRGATWDEIDLDGGVWRVPAERMKAKQEHRVPLSPAALDVLRPLHAARTGPLVFPGARLKSPLSDMSLTAVLRRMGQAIITVHGFRSSFRDWCAEETSFDHGVAEAALAHTIGSKVEAAYRRGDLFKKRRDLMDAWAAYVTGKSGGVR
jgi:integrase